jgi:hypothetical protein
MSPTLCSFAPWSIRIEYLLNIPRNTVEVAVMDNSTVDAEGHWILAGRGGEGQAVSSAEKMRQCGLRFQKAVVVEPNLTDGNHPYLLLHHGYFWAPGML